MDVNYTNVDGATVYTYRLAQPYYSVSNSTEGEYDQPGTELDRSEGEKGSKDERQTEIPAPADTEHKSRSQIIHFADVIAVLQKSMHWVQLKCMDAKIMWDNQTLSTNQRIIDACIASLVLSCIASCLVRCLTWCCCSRGIPVKDMHPEEQQQWNLSRAGDASSSSSEGARAALLSPHRSQSPLGVGGGRGGKGSGGGRGGGGGGGITGNGKGPLRNYDRHNDAESDGDDDADVENINSPRTGRGRPSPSRTTNSGRPRFNRGLLLNRGRRPRGKSFERLETEPNTPSPRNFPFPPGRSSVAVSGSSPIHANYYHATSSRAVPSAPPLAKATAVQLYR